MDRALFLAGVKGGLMKGRMGPGAVAGIVAILDAFAALGPDGDPRQLAYVLATAFHETARRFEPVRETLAGSDEAAIAVLDRAFAAGRLPGVRRPYWRRDEDGHSWLGRGYVQLTHKRNYERLGARLGIDLAGDPAAAMRPAVAAAVLVTGMAEGLFTGRRLGEFFDAAQADWTGARAIVNGRDGAAARIAAAARLIHAALLSAGAPARRDNSET